MELGKGKLLRTGLNVLYQAIHPSHGLAWTDGNQVFLTDLQLQNGEAKFGNSRVIGQFEHVCGLSWAQSAMADMPTLLAVQHKKHVTVWQLCPSTVESSKWLVSQTSEIRESLPLLPQGCVWHPKDAVLTVSTTQNVSLFPNVHCDSSRIKVDINTWDRIHCACWTQDGQRLVVAVGSRLHSYIWDSPQKTLHKCSFCPVFDVDSYICSMRATVDSQVAIATELPLDKICSLNASETFDVPLNGEDTHPPTFPVIGEMPFVDKGAIASESNSEITDSPSFSELLDLTHIHFNQARCERSSLVCLRKKDYLTGTGQDSSHLILLTLKEGVTMTRKVTIPGILVPDLIAFNLKAQVVAVASNTCNTILIYSVIPSSMPNIQQIHLESNERPKGICFLADKLLILVGTQKSTDSAFLPSSASDQYVLRLIVREILLKEESSATSNKSQSAASACRALLNKTNTKMLIKSLFPEFCHQNRGLLLTVNTSSQSRRPGRPLIKELKSPPSSVTDESIALETSSRPSSSPDHTSSPEPPDLFPKENLQKEKETYQLSKELRSLSRNLTEMQQCLSNLMDFVHNGKKFSPVYPLSKDPPYVHIIYQKPCYVGPVERRAVLLCNGKLRLSTVRQTFGLSLVEMLHDSHWILLSADSEGFIPLTFTATQVIIVRDGVLSRSDVSSDCLSHS
ncbi:WD repeat and coiled-coil-containing protein isoform X1 [Sciurus carolinensis]|uniref:WD repeat and coiled-coil-containing protein isoform X1 n=1 Tax=Sciurus carolinensis TaxID=30640 RepID=UPI001FB2A8A7|nr:WD repeat and coiled-coil-containing protein isoform X1 [Sciurus carolinensis]XP_047378518.1 WD repeat and coiled-coil-containing protein isoform X1 [Sciurus carolinensis]XP_047378520.1 WD repeat and coiled-coil-containing protein isoform X1 [Sciurus carolinensis]